MGNRPFDSLETILLPWLPQTLASSTKREVVLETLVQGYPEIAWKLILRLLPGQQQASSGTYKPRWRNTVPEDWEHNVTNPEYWRQAEFCAELAVSAAGDDADRISQLIDHFDHLPKPAFEKLIDTLASDSVSELPEPQRESIWDHLTKFVIKHRRFPDAKWALKEGLLKQLDQIAKQLAPTTPFNRCKHLFPEQEIHLYEQSDNWEEQSRQLDLRRHDAISEIYQQGGFEGVIQFTEAVESPRHVGRALGAVGDDLAENAILPLFLGSSDPKRKSLADGFVKVRRSLRGWEWCDEINKSDWTANQLGEFLAILPFAKEAWQRASMWLREHEGEYWSRANSSFFALDEEGLATAIAKLIAYGRPHAAITCLYRIQSTEQSIDAYQCVRALLAAPSSTEPSHAADGHHIVELIKALQNDASVDQDDLFQVEWTYLQLLNDRRKVEPKLLERKLADDADFFCELIQLIYPSTRKDYVSQETTEHSRSIASNAWELLRRWKRVPGCREGGSFNEEFFAHWLESVRLQCTESGHLEAAMTKAGEVLINSPSDPDGLWIHRTVATALNDATDEHLLEGYHTGTFNSRGVHWVEPNGKLERELAEQFRRKAEITENAGFHRFAMTLRSIAEDYDQQAEWTVAIYKQRRG